MEGVVSENVVLDTDCLGLNIYMFYPKPLQN